MSHEPTDWSGLPRDLFVTSVRQLDNIVWEATLCSVPMAIGPEVMYRRVEASGRDMSHERDWHLRPAMSHEPTPEEHAHALRARARQGRHGRASLGKCGLTLIATETAHRLNQRRPKRKRLHGPHTEITQKLLVAQSIKENEQWLKIRGSSPIRWTRRTSPLPTRMKAG